ncbi:MAG: tRNA (adenosine(37)-N6)-threonylcarbamoyltransferase complex transferase subunit TsaD [Myxococcales bacterium]|nr:tRNA (adenosine(37)-N6)-threonylcarbamoyltransferase complex transferase subunit TsaD [Myxococcales bacterium]
MKDKLRVLAFESSCDELSVAIIERDGRKILANIVHSQIDIHAIYGGVVPEIASRDHVRRLDAVLDKALEVAKLNLREAAELIAVTRGPGLVGCLLCGLEYAKGLAVGLSVPIVGVHHLEAHIAAADLEEEAPQTPYIALLVSGGHTHIIKVLQRGGPYTVLGSTRDDAAGEAFDKTAKLLGLGYPGGLAIDRLAQQGQRGSFSFPQPMPGRDNLDFSFSGLKTAARNLIRDSSGSLLDQKLANFCADFQGTVVDNLLRKSLRACEMHAIPRLVLAGGVAANSELRSQAVKRGAESGVRVSLPSRELCTDNAAMVARAGWLAYHTHAKSEELTFSALPNWNFS